MAEYEESLLRQQNSQSWDSGAILQSGEQQQKYNLRSNAKNSKENVAQEPAAQIAPQNTRQTRPVADHVTLKTPVQEVKATDKVFSSFSFKSEVQKLKVVVPLAELVKSELFRKPILEALELDSKQTSIDSVNLQDDKPAIVLSPMVELVDNSSPYFYVSLTIHDKSSTIVC